MDPAGKNHRVVTSYPGNASDALVQSSIAKREAYDGYTVVKCAEAWNYWFGNALVLEREAEPATYEFWLAKHAQSFAKTPVQKRVVVWESNERLGLPEYAGDVERTCRTVFMAKRALNRKSDIAEIRPLTTPEDWAAAFAIHAAEFVEYPIQRAFESWRFSIYRMDAVMKKCTMWGAWIDGELVAFLGMYADAAWTRFITPVTSPDYRRKGIFSALASAAMTAALAENPQAIVVVVADRGSDAEAIYEHLGFRVHGEQHAIITPV